MDWPEGTLRDPLPPAAPPEPQAPRCYECTSPDILWDREHPAIFPLTSCNIGVRIVCERCALHIAAQQEHLPFQPSVDDVRTLIASKRRMLAKR